MRASQLIPTRAPIGSNVRASEPEIDIIPPKRASKTVREAKPPNTAPMMSVLEDLVDRFIGLHGKGLDDTRAFQAEVNLQIPKIIQTLDDVREYGSEALFRETIEAFLGKLSVIKGQSGYIDGAMRRTFMSNLAKAAQSEKTPWATSMFSRMTLGFSTTPESLTTIYFSRSKFPFKTTSDASLIGFQDGTPVYAATESSTSSWKAKAIGILVLLGLGWLIFGGSDEAEPQTPTESTYKTPPTTRQPWQPQEGYPGERPPEHIYG
ncbi:MAG: hypothetical protein KTR14_09535 [Vampirovibrio sp.]|nr:hypothetical protein [Vampirovibrio sp.]